MACASQSMISAYSYPFPSQKISLKKPRWLRANTKLFSVSASDSSNSEEDCNAEECAPEKEVGRVSMEWLAGEKTMVAGTYPPKKKGWTGYVEKDTAGQTNIYSVEPAVYIAESAISSGSAGTSSSGAENTAAIAAGLALISVAAASSILLQVGKNAPQVQSTEYSGPPLSYYIGKFKPASIVEAAVISEPQSSPAIEASAPSEPEIASNVQAEGDASAAPEVQVELKVEGESSSVENVS
ncbi:uncharacterized protein A4U43_C02F6140 [Asparagus officinalis]|uniref:Proline-rich family protein n=1 Tax=Asparagus officinalis TaxID=4686 RepID=A0A5P1FLD4_ASPOF|nr:uncharacterized protein LOC109830263 [Asparagus officinalis]ONK77400.1 uncharacterized protein A4U43_C02F6140 [Asparagus officinalis]